MISPTVPGALAIMALPATAPKNRTTIMVGMFCARPAGDDQDDEEEHRDCVDGFTTVCFGDGGED